MSTFDHITNQIGMSQSIARDFGQQNIRCVTIAVDWTKIPFRDYIPTAAQQTTLRDCTVAVENFEHPEQFAKLVQTIVINQHINATTIELTAGLNML